MKLAIVAALGASAFVTVPGFAAEVQTSLRAAVGTKTMPLCGTSMAEAGLLNGQPKTLTKGLATTQVKTSESGAGSAPKVNAFNVDIPASEVLKDAKATRLASKHKALKSAHSAGKTAANVKIASVPKRSALHTKPKKRN